MKRLYALNHIKPAERAQRILFDEDPPRDSRLFALRVLSKATTPAEQAQAIIDNAIPYRVASTVVKQMTPTVMLALIERMSSAGADQQHRVAQQARRDAERGPEGADRAEARQGADRGSGQRLQGDAARSKPRRTSRPK